MPRSKKSSRYATKARKSSIISLEEDLDKIADPFLQKALTLAVDGTDLQELRNMMELELTRPKNTPKPTRRSSRPPADIHPPSASSALCMGLIQVMKHLENIEEVGRGIAVAFVATVYGVAVANLFFLPAASKIKSTDP